MVQDYPGGKIHLFGDSAGGGLALTLLQTLSQQSLLPMPTKTALVSPWVDLSLSNPSIGTYEIKDPILSVNALLFAAKKFAANTELTNPSLSPLYGSKEYLGKIFLLFGTNEMFYPDLKLLQKEMERAKGTSAKIYIASKMLHDWIVLPIPEARVTVRKIAHWFSEED